MSTPDPGMPLIPSLRPLRPAELVTFPDAGTHGRRSRSPLGDYWRVLVRRRWTIAMVFVAAVAASLVWRFSVRPTFTATAMLRVEREEPRVVKFEQVVRDETQGDTYQTQLQTVQRLLQSRTLASRVNTLLNLQDHPDFRPPPKPSRGFILGLFGRPAASPWDVPTTFLERLRVDPIRNARLIKLSFWSYDPALSAEVANTLVDEFMTQHVAQKVEATRYAMDFLTAQQEATRRNLEAAESQLAAFLRENDIDFVRVDRVSEPQALISQQLLSLSESLLKARAERVARESVLNNAVRGDMDAIPAVLQSPLISRLKEEDAALGRKYRELSQSFKADYPRMQRLTETIAEVKQQRREATKEVVEAISTDYRVALQNEVELRKLVEEQRTLSRNVDAKMARYNLLRREADTSRELYTALSTRLKETQIAASLLTSNIWVVDRAEAPLTSDRPSLPVSVLLGALLGLAGGIAVAFVRELLDRSIRDADEVETILQVPILGLVPARSTIEPRRGRPLARSVSDSGRPFALVTHEERSSLLAEAFRNVRTSVVYGAAEGPPRTMMVTSLQEQDGATSVSTNCAISFAQLQAGDVLLIDANMRRPTVDRIFGVPNDCGLSTFLASCDRLSDVINPAWYQTQPPSDIDGEIPGLYVMPAGPVPMNPVELLASPRFAEALTALSTRFAHIVIDAPAMSGVSDAMVLAPRMEGVILVLRQGRATLDTARHAIRMLESVRARILGVVLNHADVRAPGWGPYAKAATYNGHGHNGSHANGAE